MFSQIREVMVPEPSAMRWSLRVFGSGAFFGYFGKFRNKTFGSMLWYATRMDGFVVIRLQNGKTIALTPDDVGFANQLKAHAGMSS